MMPAASRPASRLRTMAPVTERDWYDWHHDYDHPDTPLARRLAAVQDQISAALDQARPGPLRAVSVCAGIQRTVGYCTQLCARDGTVVWTRGRRAPDLLPRICDWFAARGFAELWVSDHAEGWGAAAHRFTGDPDPLQQGARMFTFRGHNPATGPPRPPSSLSTERAVDPRPLPRPPATVVSVA